MAPFPISDKLDQTTKSIVCNVYKYYHESTKKRVSGDTLDEEILNLVVKVTGIVKTNVIDALQNDSIENVEMEKRELTMHIKNRQKRVRLSLMQQGRLRRIIASYFASCEEQPSLSKLLRVLQSEHNMDFSLEVLADELRSIGFIDTNGRQTIPSENPALVEQRIKYVREINEHRAEEHSIFLLYDSRFGFTKNTRADASLLAIHMNGEGLEGKVIYKDPNMNQTDSEWVRNILIPSLPKNAVIVSNRTYIQIESPYETPPSSATRIDILGWLHKCKVPYYTMSSKNELRQLILECINVWYHVEQKLCENNHKILLLPEHHYDLNVVDLVWEELCCSHSYNNRQERLDALLAYSSEQWDCVLQKVHEIEQEYQHITKLTNSHVQFVEDDSSMDSLL